MKTFEMINNYTQDVTIIYAETEEKAWEIVREDVTYTASNLAENECLEDDWEYYYSTEEEAFNATFEGIFEQLMSETELREVDTQDKFTYFAAKNDDKSAILLDKSELYEFFESICDNYTDFEVDFESGIDETILGEIEELSTFGETTFLGYSFIELTVKTAEYLEAMIASIDTETSSKYSGYTVLGTSDVEEIKEYIANDYVDCFTDMRYIYLFRAF